MEERTVWMRLGVTLNGTKEEIEFSRQGVIGVSSDEELQKAV